MTDPTTKSCDLLELVNDTLELPTIPEVLSRLNQVIADPDSTTADVAKVISADPAVSANMLRLVNSAYYGLQVRVSAISAAVSIMGFKMTSKVALKAAIFSTFGKSRDAKGGFDPERFWRHSICTGVAARTIGGQSGRFRDLDGEDLYVCGLLHDIGKIILFENAQDRYVSAVDDAAKSGRSQLDAENEAFGFGHTEVGSVLAIKWLLPEDLAIAIRYHHAPDQDPFHQSLSSLIHLADHVAWSSGNPSAQGPRPPQLDVGVYDEVGVEAQQLEELLPQIHEDFASIEMPW